MAQENNIFILVNSLIGDNRIEDAIKALIGYAEERSTEIVYMDLFETATNIKRQFGEINRIQTLGTHAPEKIMEMRNNVTERIQQLARFMHNPEMYTDKERSRQKTEAEALESIYLQGKQERKEIISDIKWLGRKALKVYLIITVIILIFAILGGLKFCQVFNKIGKKSETFQSDPIQEAKYFIVFDEMVISSTGSLNNSDREAKICFRTQIGDKPIEKAIEYPVKNYILDRFPPEYRPIPLNVRTDTITDRQSYSLIIGLDRTKERACSDTPARKLKGTLSTRTDLMQMAFNGNTRYTVNLSGSTWWNFEVTYHYEKIE